MEWISVKDKMPDYEKAVIIWHTDLHAKSSFFTQGWWIFNYPGKNNGFDVVYYDPEQVTHWMYWPDKPKDLFTEWELYEHNIMEELRNGRN